jgi:hypothetical protein
MPISKHDVANSDSTGAGYRRTGPALMLVFVAMSILAAANSGWCQAKSPSATLAASRHKYVGAQVTIKGPLESASQDQLATYINWRVAKRGPGGRYHAVSPIAEARLPFGYERHGGSIIAVQLSDNQSKEPWMDPQDKTHAAGAQDPNLDFVVKFDDQVVAVCTCPLTAVDGNFSVVHSPIPAQ